MVITNVIREPWLLEDRHLILEAEELLEHVVKGINNSVMTFHSTSLLLLTTERVKGSFRIQSIECCCTTAEAGCSATWKRPL